MVSLQEAQDQSRKHSCLDLLLPSPNTEGDDAWVQGMQPSVLPIKPEPLPPHTYQAFAVLAVPSADPEWQGRVKLTFGPAVRDAVSSPRHEPIFLDLGPKFRHEASLQTVALRFPLPYPPGAHFCPIHTQIYLQRDTGSSLEVISRIL